MAYAARKINLKHVVHIALLTSIMTMGGNVLFSKSKHVHAGNLDASKITKERLDAFYDASVEVQLEGGMDTIAFYERHLHKEYEGVMHLTSKIDNAPAKEETIVLTKFEHLRDIKKAYELGTIEGVQSGIVSYELSEDLRSAQVKDRTYSVASIPLPADGGKSSVYHLRQFINCDNSFVLSDDDIILLKANSCKIEVQMSKVQASQP